MIPLNRAMFDTLVNFVSKLGTSKDKSYWNQYALNMLQSREQLEFAYRGDWIARKAVDIPAEDATREWRNWQAELEHIQAIEAEERRLELQSKTEDALIKARLYGGSIMLMGLPGEPEQPVNVETITKGQLEFVHVLHRFELGTAELERNILSPYYGQPKQYTFTGQVNGMVTVHPSRVIRFTGRSLPDVTQTTDGWGDSILQAVDDAIKNAASSSQNVSALINEAKTDVVKIPNFMSQIGTQTYKDLLFERLTASNTAKSILNTILLDKEEEWQRITTSFTGLPDLMKLYMLIACGAVDVPATRFLSQSAVGLGSTGEGDLKNYYDSVASKQKNKLSPSLAPLDEALLRSALGGRPDEITYEWAPLWQMSETERSEVDLKRAQVFKIDVDSQLFDPEVLAEARVNQLVEDGTYPGLDTIVLKKDDEDLEEKDPEVEEQFKATKEKPAEEAEPGAEAPVEEPQKQAMNGAQVASLKEIVLAVGNKELPLESAISLVTICFPTVSETQARELLGPLEEFDPPKKAAPPAFGQPGNPVPPKPGEPGEQPEDPENPEDEEVVDAEPRTLYVRRDVKNTKDILDWARGQGLEPVPGKELHVTVAHSSAPVDWMKLGTDCFSYDKDGLLRIEPGGPRIVEELGDEGAIVLFFYSSSLSWRHCDLKERGCSWDFPDYQPHVTITYKKPEGMNIRDIEPYRGPIVFGPEIFEEIDE